MNPNDIPPDLLETSPEQQREVIMFALSAIQVQAVSLLDHLSQDTLSYIYSVVIRVDDGTTTSLSFRGGISSAHSNILARIDRDRILFVINTLRRRNKLGSLETRDIGDITPNAARSALDMLRINRKGQWYVIDTTLVSQKILDVLCLE